MARIAVIDDDLAMDILSESLCSRRHEAYRITSVAEALRDVERIVCADLIVLDIIMSWPADMEPKGPAGALAAGMEVLREIRMRKPNIPVIAYSATQDNAVVDAIHDDPCTSFLSKWEVRSLRELVHCINGRLGHTPAPDVPQPFIVHGHNDNVKLALKNYLQNTLHLPEPTVLHEQPSLGRTIIEKFEDYAAESSIVFVLLTPDDVAAPVGDTDALKRRARQNVVFEMGYFLGTLGRKSGRIILLYQPPLELPSDISGVIYIDISKGIEGAGEQIRREVANVSD